MIARNRTRSSLKKYGYTFVAFSSGSSFTEIKDADIYMRPRVGDSAFVSLVLNATPLPNVLNRISNFSCYLNKLEKYHPYYIHKMNVLYTLDHLANIPQVNHPFFVFAHIMVPHPPFVFREGGEKVNFDRPYTTSDGSHLLIGDGVARHEYIEGYREQLKFINNKIEQNIERILSHSTKPPIIILQSDHGPGSWLDHEDINKTYLKERMSILNAYYFPDNDYSALYEEITPVNTFRVIFNEYFGADYELLEDKSYYCTWSCPNKLIEVTARIGTKQDEEALR
jgi:hypothetical protein